MSHDMVFEQTKTIYDLGDNAIQATHWRRSPRADWGALGIRRGKLVTETVAPQARVSHVASWHDALGRIVAAADYGANGVSALVRPQQIPNSSDALLVTRTRYNARGELFEQLDAAGRNSVTTYDDAGRAIEEVENYSWIPWPGSSRSANFTYTPDGLPKTIRASNLLTGEQLTEYVYGGSFDGLPLSTLLQRVSDPQGRLTKFTYNRQRETTWRTDANGTTHCYTYDKLARLRNDALITLGTNIDGRVHQIGYEYTDEGQLKSITSFSGSPKATMVNQVERGFNQFGLITWEFQHHSAAEPSSSYPLRVDYGYDVGAPAPGIAPVYGPRLAAIGYPPEASTSDRFAVHFDYADQHGSGALNRVVSVAEGVPAGRPPDPALSAIQTTAGAHWGEYTYWGLENVFGILLPEADPASPLRHVVENLPSGPPYSRLDLFDRPRLWRWDGVSSGAHDEALYGYDRLGARTARLALGTSLGQLLDEAYQYDGLARLQRVDRGKVVAGLPSGTLSTPQPIPRHFYYTHDWRLLEEREPTPGQLPGQARASRRYVWGVRGPDDLLFRDRRYTATGNLRDRLYALPDANGNITALYNPAPSGTGVPLGVVERFWYDPYGKPLYFSPTFTAKPQSNYGWNVLYGGYYYDAETGLYLVRNRIYHPLYGRWLQIDPEGFTDSYNLYQYCLSSPLTYLDPTGEILPLIIPMIVIGLAGVAAAHYGAHEMDVASRSVDMARYERGTAWFAGGVAGVGAAIAIPAAAATFTGVAGAFGTTLQVPRHSWAQVVGRPSLGLLRRVRLEARFPGRSRRA